LNGIAVVVVMRRLYHHEVKRLRSRRHPVLAPIARSRPRNTSIFATLQQGCPFRIPIARILSSVFGPGKADESPVPSGWFAIWFEIPLHRPDNLGSLRTAPHV
jgi:hypothetical protein